MSYSAAFLDRDGTVIRDARYVSDPSSVELLPRAARAIARLNAARIPVILVTNQSGIGRGLYPLEAFLAVQREVERRLASHAARLDGVYFCPHDPERERCECRKPGVALYRRAAAERGIRLREALFVGDRESDVLPALTFGGAAFLLRGDSGASVSPPDVGASGSSRGAGGSGSFPGADASGSCPGAGPPPPGCEVAVDLWDAVDRALGRAGRPRRRPGEP